MLCAGVWLARAPSSTKSAYKMHMAFHGSASDGPSNRRGCQFSTGCCRFADCRGAKRDINLFIAKRLQQERCVRRGIGVHYHSTTPALWQTIHSINLFVVAIDVAAIVVVVVVDVGLPRCVGRFYSFLFCVQYDIY